MTSKTPKDLLIHMLKEERSPFLCPYAISTWQLGAEAIYRGEYLQVQQASRSEEVKNQAVRRELEQVYSCSIVVSQNLASCNYFLVEVSLAAVAIFWGQYQDTL
jgi:hypothetical protein